MITKTLSQDINDYEKLRVTALSENTFCSNHAKNSLWQFSSCGMAKWLQTSFSEVNESEIFQENKNNIECQYPHEIIYVLTDMALSNL